MGEKQDRLGRLFHSVGLKVLPKSIPFPTAVAAQTSSYALDILDVYRELGGKEQQFPLRLRAWDFEVNGIAVELDEQLHFNAYRAMTLQSKLYDRLPKFPLQEYQAFCVQRSHECLKAGSYGGKWTNPSCEKQFGPAAPSGDLSGNGAPRWKQRAFYDFVKDISPLLIGIRIVRLSIWDSVGVKGQNILIKDAVYRSHMDTGIALHDLVMSRA